MSRISLAGAVACLFLASACGPSMTAGTLTPTEAAIAAPSPVTTIEPSSAPPSATPAGPVLPVIADTDPRIAYTHLTGTGGGVFVMRPDGTDAFRLGSDAPGTHKHLDWSPDGRHIVFIDDTSEKMWIANLDGSPSESVGACDTRGCDYPAWSPDGTKIAFSRYEDTAGVTGPGAVGIYTVDVASGEVTTVIRLERPLLADVPRWSPDGTQIVFGVDQMDDDANEIGAAIAIVPVGGGEPRYLTDFDTFGYYPDWNRVTDEIVFSTEVLGYKKAPAPGDDTWNLYAVMPDGTGLRQITDVPAGKRLWNPTWTPDGTRITAGFEDSRHGVFVDPKTGAIDPFPATDKMSRPRMRPTP